MIRIGKTGLDNDFAALFSPVTRTPARRNSEPAGAGQTSLHPAAEELIAPDGFARRPAEGTWSQTRRPFDLRLPGPLAKTEPGAEP